MESKAIDESQDSLELEKESFNPKDLSKTKFRYLILLLACFLCFGSYFIYDNPSALQTQLQEDLNIDLVEFGLLYSVYAFPNIILPFFGGYLVDILGVRVGIMIFCSVVALGQGVFAFGVTIKSYPIALLGRAIFGCGAESLGVTQSTIVSKWFSGKDLSMALSMNICISRCASVLNYSLEPLLLDLSGSVSLGLWVGFAVCLGSLSCGLAIIGFDKRRDKILGVKDRKSIPESEKVRFSDIKTFGYSFWMICTNIVFVYISIICFNNFASNYYQERFGYTTQEAGLIISIVYAVSAILCPISGKIIDKIGRRVLALIIAASFVTLTFVLFMLTPDSNRSLYPIFYTIILGIGDSINSSIIWSCIPYLVEHKCIATAFGMSSSIQNLGLSIGPMVVGIIYENSTKDHGYFWPTFFLAFMGFCGILTTITIYFYDIKHGGVLNSSDPMKAIEMKRKDKKFKSKSVNDHEGLESEDDMGKHLFGKE
ncbi:hypothetical protein SteCoe_13130 [Stentor coeruleus]|uniref:Lysosomal dipeptide transporter MFSD1 n=1 Tax=Stentor coeruleus TaxID=5963 RepID=A0A1R2C924_9CILI|nr:hypothetical protein SteCoe_13130 [Stentor coeruleus]